MGFNVGYSAGGELDKVKVIERITNFATKSQPYNEMSKFDIPSMGGEHEFEYISPNVEAELLAITVTCSGYGENDRFDLYCNDVLWFNNWYTSEVKEGLFIGTSTYVCLIPPQSKFRLVFKNESSTSKICWLGIRMLI